MSKLMEILHSNKVFYVATADDEGPHVRPFGAVVEFESKAWFCSHNQKAVVAQLKGDSRLELVSLCPPPEMSWVRMSGKAVFEDNAAAKAAMLKHMPILEKLYEGQMDHFVVFYLENVKATLRNFDGSVAEELTL